MKSLTEFSADKVNTKYELIQTKFSENRKWLVSSLIIIGTIGIGTVLMKVQVVLGLSVIVLITLLWSKVYNLFFPFTRTGNILEFNESLVKVTKTGETISEIPYSNVKSIRIKTLIEEPCVRFTYHIHKAYSLLIKTKDGDKLTLKVLNSLYETQEDRLQFKSTPPLLTSVLKYLSAKNLVSIYNWKGRKSDHF